MPSEKDHGPHTLKVWKGVVVGVYGADVFVELGIRMQGVISTQAFETTPKVGDEFEFTLRGREDGLWALQRRETQSLATWEDMQSGDLVHARAVRANRDGLELKIGPLHAFMPLQAELAVLQADVPLHELMPVHFTPPCACATSSTTLRPCLSASDMIASMSAGSP